MRRPFFFDHAAPPAHCRCQASPFPAPVRNGPAVCARLVFGHFQHVRVADMQGQTLFLYPPKEDSRVLNEILLPAGAAPSRVDRSAAHRSYHRAGAGRISPEPISSAPSSTCWSSTPRCRRCATPTDPAALHGAQGSSSFNGPPPSASVPIGRERQPLRHRPRADRSRLRAHLLWRCR
jgi:hypothetical protein